MEMSDLPELLTTVETSQVLRKAESSLIQDRWLGKGLPYVHVGRLVFYLKSDIIEFLHANRKVPAQELAERHG